MVIRAFCLVTICACPSFGEALSRSAGICVAPLADSDAPLASSGDTLLQRTRVQGLKTALTEVAQTVSTARKSQKLQISEHQSFPYKDATTFFYHYHIPRTGGTTVAYLILADICEPFAPDVEVLLWTQVCTKTCERGLSDNAFSCYPGREWAEHVSLSWSLQRGQDLMARAGAERIVYVTTLRYGFERVKSQWLYQMKVGEWPVPPGMVPISNESLQLYVLGEIADGVQTSAPTCHIGCDIISQRNNEQVTFLSSVVPGSAHIVNREDLELAKQALMTGRWLIGFSECMEEVHQKLLDYAVSLHGGYIYKDVPHISQSTMELTQVSEAWNIKLDEKTTAILNKESSLDNELYNWAWGMALRGEDDRFARTC